MASSLSNSRQRDLEILWLRFHANPDLFLPLWVRQVAPRWLQGGLKATQKLPETAGDEGFSEQSLSSSRANLGFDFTRIPTHFGLSGGSENEPKSAGNRLGQGLSEQSPPNGRQKALELP